MTTMFKCLECGELADEAGDTLYECGGCCTRFTRGNSADGYGNRCPDCRKFSAKLADQSCVACEEGEVEEVEEVEEDEDGIDKEKYSIQDRKPEAYWRPSTIGLIPYCIRVDGRQRYDIDVIRTKGEWQWRERSFPAGIDVSKWNPIYNLEEWKAETLRDLRRQLAPGPIGTGPWTG